MKYVLLLVLINNPIYSYENNQDGDYESLPGCEKQNILWRKIESTKHETLPEYKKLGVVQVGKMALQRIRYKSDLESDFTPDGWIKYLHQKSSVAKVSFRKNTRSIYSGVFQGAECAIVRLSITYKPTRKKAFAPGLALKVFRDKVPSANVSALYALNGQGHDYNFFKNPLSNIVPRGTSIGEKAIHKIFKKVSYYPEELLVNHFGSHDQYGASAMQSFAPRQIFFVPTDSLKNKFKSSEHDIREDFHTLPKGTILYQVKALVPHKKSDNYVEDYKIEDISAYANEAVHIGDIVTESEFISSEFGDTGIFFKHEVRRK